MPGNRITPNLSRFGRFVAEVEANLADTTVEFQLGRAREGEHGIRRRVMMYRAGGLILAPKRAGGAMVGGEGGVRIPTIYDRHESVDVVLHAESEESLDQLLDNMINAIDKVAPNGGINWENYEWNENEIAQRVPQVRLRFAVKLPVAEEIRPLTIITAEEMEFHLIVPPETLDSPGPD